MWKAVPNRSLIIGGDTCWRGEGVSVYKLNRDGDQRPIVRHIRNKLVEHSTKDEAPNRQVLHPLLSEKSQPREKDTQIKGNSARNGEKI